ncbi:MAG TPA: LytTR family DNA-binding domain-containing protein [Clostridiaceae bacterium]
MKIAICDDDKLELEKAKNAVEEFIASRQSDLQISLDTFESGDELLSCISRQGGFDLLILDIIMPGMNGLELAEELRRNNSNCKIIFLTSSPEFAVNSYKYNAFYYLLKPFSSLEIKSLMGKALDEMGEEKSKIIVVKEKGKLTKVQIHRIKYIESVKHIIIFHLSSNQVINCYGTMNEFHDILLSDKRFTKCHKSFIVNMNYVISISSKDFIMDDKTLIPISRQTYQGVKNQYIDYFFEKGSELI